jgi:tRNA G10  N-methylase Trm11
MFAFWLGREFKLSIAELFAVFPGAKFEYLWEEIALISGIEKKDVLARASRLWGVIKIIQLSPEYRGKPEENIYEDAQKKEGKFSFWLSVFWENSIKVHLMRIKKHLKERGISVRFVNKNFSNLSSAQVIGENLVQKWSDYSLIVLGRTEYFWKTIWVQDIASYGKRDYGKTRDMQVGMLPPKLAQIMINLAREKNFSVKTSPIDPLLPGEGDMVVYDPFCGLWTVLIESILMWNSAVYGSDISRENIEKTRKNIDFARSNFENRLETSDLLVLDAKWISSSPLLKNSEAIVTEGFLGQIFQKYSVTEKKILEVQDVLLDIYQHFFLGLKKANFKGNIVISFPFWDIRGKYFYFSKIYDIINQYCETQHLLPYHESIKHTRSWSLLYKRKDQVVGREIFKLKMK